MERAFETAPPIVPSITKRGPIEAINPPTTTMISFITGLRFENQSARSLAISASFSNIGASAP